MCDVLNGEFAATKLSAEGLFLLPIYVIMKLTKSLALWERWRRSRRRGQNGANTIKEKQ